VDAALAGTRRWIQLAEKVTQAKREKSDRMVAELRKMEMRSRMCVRHYYYIVPRLLGFLCSAAPAGSIALLSSHSE
jgi:hypothetical protein